MKSFRYSTPDFIAVFFICCILGITGFALSQSKNNTSYSVKQEEKGIIDEEAAVLDVEEDVVYYEEITYTPDLDKTLKTSKYNLDMVYNSIRNQKNSTVTIDGELNDIYQHFYDYFDSTNNFINSLGESYNYDEYMFVTNFSLIRNNTNMFGMYLITYSKCDVFSTLENHSRDNMLSTYCK